jgi:hypothetical protein
MFVHPLDDPFRSNLSNQSSISSSEPSRVSKSNECSGSFFENLSLLRPLKCISL